MLVTVTLVQRELTFSPAQLSLLFTFHMFTFSSVLRLEKYPMVFSAGQAQNSVVVVPLLASSHTAQPTIDWPFLHTIANLATRRLRCCIQKRNGFSKYADFLLRLLFKSITKMS